MKKYGSSLIIGVDAGYGNMKTAGSLYPTGLTAMDTEPMFEGDILKYNGIWYRIGEGHKPFIDDKTEDDDFYILTLASVACELSQENITHANVILAVGLPTTWTKRQKKDYREYMLKNQDVQFTFRKKDYRFHFTDCLVFPQGYSAAIRRIDDDKQHIIYVNCGHFVGPFNYNWNNVHHEISMQDFEAYPINFAWFMRELSAVSNSKAIFNDDNPYFVESLKKMIDSDNILEKVSDEQLRLFKKYAAIEPSWRKRESIVCDLYFPILLALSRI